MGIAQKTTAINIVEMLLFPMYARAFGTYREEIVSKQSSAAKSDAFFKWTLVCGYDNPLDNCWEGARSTHKLNLNFFFQVHDISMITRKKELPR